PPCFFCRDRFTSRLRSLRKSPLCDEYESSNELRESTAIAICPETVSVLTRHPLAQAPVQSRFPEADSNSTRTPGSAVETTALPDTVCKRIGPFASTLTSPEIVSTLALRMPDTLMSPDMVWMRTSPPIPWT